MPLDVLFVFITPKILFDCILCLTVKYFNLGVSMNLIHD